MKRVAAMIFALLGLGACDRSATFDRSAAATSPETNRIGETTPDEPDQPAAQSSTSAAQVGQQMRAAAATPPPPH